MLTRVHPDARPLGWTTRRLGEVSSEITERAGAIGLPVLSVTKHRGIVLADTFFSKTVHGRDTSKYKIVRRGQFAYATIHLDEGSVGRLEVVDAGLVSPMYTVFEIDEAAVDPEFLLTVLKAPATLAQYRALVQGSVNRRGSVSFEALAALYLTHPPKAEQQQISATLRKVGEAIASGEAVVDQLVTVRRALSRELLGDAARSGPGKWDPAPLCSRATVVRGSTPRPAKDPRFFNGSDTPWITVGELSKDDWPYLTETNAFLTAEGRERARFLPKGTVVLVNSGFGLGVPKILALAGCANDGIAACLDLRGDVNPLFLCYALASRTEWLRNSLARGVDQPNLNTSLIGGIEIEWPSRIEQDAIAAEMLAVDERIRAERRYVEQLKAVKVALCHAVLTGATRLRLPQQQEVA